MKKYLKYMISFVVIIAIVLVAYLANSKSSRTIEKILGVSFDNIKYVTSGSAQSHDNVYDVNKFINEYKNKKYRKYSGNIGGTTHIYYVCYDENDNVILTLVEIGNKDLVFLKKGQFDINNDASKNIYQLETN